MNEEITQNAPLARLIKSLHQFKIDPSGWNSAYLRSLMVGFQNAVHSGAISSSPQRTTGYFHNPLNSPACWDRLLEDTLADFQSNPSDERMGAVMDATLGFMAATSDGREKP